MYIDMNNPPRMFKANDPINLSSYWSINQGTRCSIPIEPVNFAFSLFNPTAVIKIFSFYASEQFPQISKISFGNQLNIEHSSLYIHLLHINFEL